MDRRSLLRSLGGTFVAATAGCMGSGGNDPTPTDEPTPSTDETGLSATGTGDDGTRPADGVTPGPTVDVAGSDCPTVRADADLRVCSLTTDLEDAPVALVPPDPPRFRPTTGDDTVETIDFELRNQSESNFGFNPYDWTLKRHTDDGWDHVAPDATPEPWTILSPGGSYTYGLAVESVPNQKIDGARRIVLDLDSGVYALLVDGQLGTGDDGEWIECAAVFTVERTDG